MNAHDRLDHALAQITRECSPLCRVISDADDTNHHQTEHALGCPVWHRICAEREERMNSKPPTEDT